MTVLKSIRALYLRAERAFVLECHCAWALDILCSAGQRLVTSISAVYFSTAASTPRRTRDPHGHRQQEYMRCMIYQGLLIIVILVCHSYRRVCIKHQWFGDVGM